MTGNGRNIHELADEYVLGLLEPVEHARLQAEIEHDAELRAAVAANCDRFLELDLLAKPVPVSAGLWDRIASQLGQSSAKISVEDGPVPIASGATTPPSVLPANDNAVSRWRMMAFAGMAASLLLAAAVGWSLMSGPAPRVIAVLVNEKGVPLVLVEDYGNATARVTPLTDFQVPTDRTMQVWTLPSVETGPVSLGLLARSETTVLDGPALPGPREEQLYEITIEQRGGSPTGRPTGPILVKGFAKLPR